MLSGIDKGNLVRASGIRTVAVATPAVMLDLLRRLANRRIRLDVVAVLHDRRGLASRLRRLKPDLVIVGLSYRQSAAAVEDVLSAVPTAKAIVLTKGPERLAGYELRLHRTDLADVAPAALIAFISDAGSRRASHKQC